MRQQIRNDLGKRGGGVEGYFGSEASVSVYSASTQGTYLVCVGAQYGSRYNIMGRKLGEKSKDPACRLVTCHVIGNLVAPEQGMRTVPGLFCKPKIRHLRIK